MKEIVIKMPDKVYDYVRREWIESDFDSPLNHVMNGVKNGIVLPEGHGELRDTNTIMEKFYEDCMYSFMTEDDLNELEHVIRRAKVLVEADIKEKDEER